MPPKAINYKANSIVYFSGDKGEFVYILQKGQVSLNSQDIQSGKDLHDFVQTGEFFGVKAAFGRYPHDETAVVLVDSTIIQFSVDDFEQLLSTNDRVILKMLKVFSNQLRRIHNQVQSLLSSDETINQEKGLFSVGEYYFNNKKYQKAVDAFRRYLIYYPSGEFEEEVRKKLEYSEAQKNSGMDESYRTQAVIKPAVEKKSFSIEEARQLRDRKEYAEAFNTYIKSIQLNPEIRLEAEFEAGVCLYELNKSKDVITHFTGILKRNPVHKKMGDCLYYIGKSHLAQNNIEKARGFLTKSVSLMTEGSPEARDAILLLNQIEEKS